MSFPCASGVMPAATEEAAPPLDPPGVCCSDHGFQVRPRRSFSVSSRKLKAGVLVRPMMTAPAAVQFATTGLSSWAMRLRNATTPFVVAQPAWSMFSLIVTGTPCSAPRASPRATAASARSAAAPAAAPRSTVTAFSRGLTAAIRSRHDDTASLDEISRRAIAPAMRVASHRQISSVMSRIFLEMTRESAVTLHTQQVCSAHSASRSPGPN